MGGFLLEQSNLFFEVHNGDSVNIAMLKYNFENDEFEDLVYITRDAFINQNQDVLKTSINSCVAAWETDRNGNFDIAYSKCENEIWQPVQIVAETEEDETEISFVKNQNIFDCECALAVFNRNGSVFMIDLLNDPQLEDTVFTANGSVTYSQAVAGYGDLMDQGLIAAAIRDSANVTSELVYRIKDDSGLWGEIKTVNLEGKKNNPSLDLIGNIVFDNIVNGKSSVHSVNLENGDKEIIFSDSIDSYFNFKTVFFEIVTKGTNDYLLRYPYVLQKQSSERNYVVASFAYDLDTSVAVSVFEPQPTVGTLGVVSSNYVSYSVWVDSVNGHTNLFGVKRLDSIGDVNDDKNSISGFKLYQNYPNPFSKGMSGNSSTTIRFSIVRNANFASPTTGVTLKVYDVLGNEVKTLIDKKLSAGEYEVGFDGNGLSTGIYFYCLQIGEFTETKKMLFLK